VQVTLKASGFSLADSGSQLLVDPTNASELDLSDVHALLNGKDEEGKPNPPPALFKDGGEFHLAPVPEANAKGYSTLLVQRCNAFKLQGGPDLGDINLLDPNDNGENTFCVFVRPLAPCRGWNFLPFGTLCSMTEVSAKADDGLPDPSEVEEEGEQNEEGAKGVSRYVELKKVRYRTRAAATEEWKEEKLTLHGVKQRVVVHLERGFGDWFWPGSGWGWLIPFFLVCAFVGKGLHFTHENTFKSLRGAILQPILWILVLGSLCWYLYWITETINWS
jgi:hypothetical protein